MYILCVYSMYTPLNVYTLSPFWTHIIYFATSLFFPILSPR